MESHQFRNEQKEPPTSSRKLARSQREFPYIGYWLDRGAWTIRTLFIQTARQGSKAFRLEHLGGGRWAEGRLPLPQIFAYLKDRIVFFPEDRQPVGEPLTSLAATEDPVGVK